MVTPTELKERLVKEQGGDKIGPDECWFCGETMPRDAWFIDVILMKGCEDEVRDRVLHRACLKCAQEPGKVFAGECIDEEQLLAYDH